MFAAGLINTYAGITLFYGSAFLTLALWLATKLLTVLTPESVTRPCRLRREERRQHCGNYPDNTRRPVSQSVSGARPEGRCWQIAQA